MEIRKFSMGDYNSLISLWERAELPFKREGRDSFQVMQEEEKRGCSFILLMTEREKVIGSVLVSQDGRKGWINRLAVDPDYRRRGIGHKLIEEAENRLFSQGIGIIACLIEGWNKTSMEVFEAAGYKRFEDVHYFTKRKFPGI